MSSSIPITHKPSSARKRTAYRDLRDVASEGKNNDGASELLLHFVRTKVMDRRPRGTTGTIPIKKEGDVMVVGKDESLPSVFKKLTTEGFLSAPVEDYMGRYIGFITMFDLVKFTNGLFWGQTEEEWVEFWNAKDRFRETKVSDIMRVPNQWTRDPFHPILKEFSLFSCMEMMARMGTHRLGVVNPLTKMVCGIETQSGLISELRQYKHLMGPLSSKRVKEFVADLHWRVYTVKNTDKAINAFTEMESRKVQGLAVVNEAGFLVDSISIRDLRGVGDSGQTFWRLFHPVSDFKEYVRSRFPKVAPSTHYSSKRTPRSALYCTLDDTMETVIDLMEDGNIHRIYVCDEDSDGNPTPLHVISQRDVLLQVLSYMTQ